MKALVFLWDFPLIMNAIKEYQGQYYRILIVDKEDRMPEYILSKELIKETFEEVIIVNNINDKAEVSEAIENILKRMEIKALYATFEEAMEMAGYLRDKFNIEGMKEEQAVTVRNKYIMKEQVRKGDIRTARVKVVRKLSDVKEFVAENGYPIIFKPVDGAATVDTYKITSKQDMELLEQEFLNKNKAKLESGKYVVEEFILGGEYHCDSVVAEGNVQFVSIGKYLHNCIETINTDKPLGSIIFPDDCEENEILDKIKHMNKQVVKQLAIQNAICHMEVFIKKDGTIVFSEIAARIGGGPLIGNCIKNTHGIDIYKAFLQVELKEFNQSARGKKGRYSGFVAFPTKKGVITSISKEAEFESAKGFVLVKIFNKTGDVIHEKDNTGDRTGYLIMEADNYEDLKNKLEQQYKKFQLKVKDA